MTSLIQESSTICQKTKHFGYRTSTRIRLYGEHFEVLSDPFPERGGLAIRVRNLSDLTIRIVLLPASILGSRFSFELPEGKRQKAESELGSSEYINSHPHVRV
jgi:hypothetical protein